MKERTLYRIIALIFLIVVWTYWCPLLVAIVSKTMTQDEITDRVYKINQSAKTYIEEQNRLNSAIRELETKISMADSSELESLIEEYELLSNFAQNYSKRLRLAKYANSQTRHYYFVSYLALSVCLLFRIRNMRSTNEITQMTNFHTKSILLGVTFYIFFHWSNWLRNSSYGHEDRRLFSYAHFDVSPPGFIFQEIQAFGLMILAGYITCLFIIPLPSKENDKRMNLDQAYIFSRDVKRKFEAWQIYSLLLILAFLPWTIFFWRIVLAIGESRYFASAVSIHVIWLLIWIVITIPIIKSFEHWHDFTACFASDQSPELVSKIQALEPVSKNMFVLSASTGVLSFIFPIAQSFF
ncbi:hypothetical protein [Gimesia sp.]|uniref:hypothetical protein n=1 Tax=Gimesia sp. TaxID=2024833 RepID=UPI003A9447E9